MSTRNPGIPLTKAELVSIGAERNRKQFFKRILLVLIPTLVVALIGLGVGGAQTSVLGLTIIGVAIAGLLTGMLVISFWYDKANRLFASTHAGSFWSTDSESKE